MSNRSVTTRVSKTDPTIKRILAATAKDYKGLSIDVNELVDVESWWDYTLTTDDLNSKIWITSPTGSDVEPVPIPRGFNQGVKLPFPIGRVLVRSYSYGKGIWIDIERLDPSVMEIALDAVLANEKKDAATILKQLGSFAGLGMAIVDGRAKALTKGEEIAKGTKKGNRRIEREIDEALRSRS